MEKKLYEIKLFSKVWRLELRKGEYMANGNLAVMAISDDDGDTFATLTVNLQVSLPGNCALIDTNNNPWAEEFLKKNKIAKPTGRCVSSGFCTFPVYEFDKKILSEMGKI